MAESAMEERNSIAYSKKRRLGDLGSGGIGRQHISEYLKEKNSCGERQGGQGRRVIRKKKKKVKEEGGEKLRVYNPSRGGPQNRENETK